MNGLKTDRVLQWVTVDYNNPFSSEASIIEERSTNMVSLPVDS